MNLSPKSFVGYKQEMSLSENTTPKLFQQLMQLRSKVEQNASFIYDIKIYPSSYFQNFSPTTNFIKWVALENTPQLGSCKLDGITLSGGLYAKFNNPYGFGNPKVYQDIFQKWLPSSDYQLDQRPHFDVFVPQKDPSQIAEDIFIPIKPK